MNNQKQIQERIARLQSALDRRLPIHIRKKTIERIKKLNGCLKGNHRFIKMMFVSPDFEISDPVICCEYCGKKKYNNKVKGK